MFISSLRERLGKRGKLPSKRTEPPAPPVTSGPEFVLKATGVCPVCEQATEFKSENPWLRDYFICVKCGSIPRERALAAVLSELRPNWRDLEIHESSPSSRVSARLARECGTYTATQYDLSTPFGTMSPDGGYRSEDLEAQTFADASFDLVITQDVFEHIFHPDRAAREIARTLRPGGLHIFTVPLVRKAQASGRRATISPDGAITHLLPAEYHQNPIDASGSLVTVDWGYDIAGHILNWSGMVTTIYSIDDLSRGIRAEFNEVLVSSKLMVAEL